MHALVCEVLTTEGSFGSWCDVTRDGSDGDIADGPTVDTVPPDVAPEIAEQRYAEAAQRHGGRIAALHEQLQQALADGNAELAAEIDAELSHAVTVVESGERGELFAPLVTASDDDFDELVARDSHHTEQGHAVRYFETEASDGDGMLLFDFFIHQERSLFLAGDDRDFPGSGSPFDESLAVEDSRMMLAIDKETGRGKVVTTRTCTIRGNCAPARDIHMDGESHWPSFGSRANHFEVEANDNEMVVEFTGLNSQTPLVVSVDGEVQLQRDDDGWSVSGGQRDGYPALGIYHADGDRVETISQQCGGGFPRASPPSAMDVEEVSEQCR